MIVLDASVVVDVLLGNAPYAGQVVRCIEELGGQSVMPHLLDVEVGQVLRRLVHQNVISSQRGKDALGDLADWPAQRYPHGFLLPMAWSWRHNVTVYDGVYLALALTLDAVLLTRDAALCRVPQCGARVVVVGAGSEKAQA